MIIEGGREGSMPGIEGGREGRPLAPKRAEVPHNRKCKCKLINDKLMFHIYSQICARITNTFYRHF